MSFKIKELYSQIERFWFAPQPLIISSLFRVSVGLTLFLFYFARLMDFDFLFSEKGIVPYSLSVTMVPDFFRPPLTIYPASESLLYGAHVLFVVLLLALTFGVGGRIVAFLCWILQLSFIQRNAVVIYGPDFIATCWLMYMWLLKTDAYLTLPQFIRKQDLLPSLKNMLACSKNGDSLNTVGVRFVQIQLCIIYGYGGLEKLKGLTWWRGDAIWNTLANGQLVTHDFGFISHVPLIVIVLTYVTLMFEIYFPALIWNSRLRPFLLGFGVLLHLGIGMTMNIPTFSLLMIWSYVLFLQSPQPRESHPQPQR